MTSNPGTGDQRIGMIQLAGAMAIAGTVGVFVQESGQSPVNAVFFRCLFGLLFLAAYCLWHGDLRVVRPSRRALALIALGGVCIVLNWVAFFAAIARTSIALTTIVYHVHPFWVVLLGSALFGERLTLDKLGWMGLAFLGLALAVDLGGAGLGDGDHLAGIGL